MPVASPAAGQGHGEHIVATGPALPIPLAPPQLPIPITFSIPVYPFPGIPFVSSVSAAAPWLELPAPAFSPSCPLLPAPTFPNLAFASAPPPNSRCFYYYHRRQQPLSHSHCCRSRWKSTDAERKISLVGKCMVNTLSPLNSRGTSKSSGKGTVKRVDDTWWNLSRSPEQDCKVSHIMILTDELFFSTPRLTSLARQTSTTTAACYSTEPPHQLWVLLGCGS